MTLSLTPIHVGELILTPADHGASVSSLTATYISTNQIGMVAVRKGFYSDFALGQAGTDVTINDPRSNTKWSAVTVSTSGVAPTYDPTVVVDPLPMAVKFTNNFAATSYLSWDSRTIGAMASHYGRLYVLLSAAPNQNLRVAAWQGDGGAAGALRITTGRLLSILDASFVSQASSTMTLTAGTWYRLEWSVVHDASAGSVTVRIYEGNSEDVSETVTATGINTGTVFDTGNYGNVNNSNLGNIPHWIAAVADGYTNWVGPYTGLSQNQIDVVDEDGYRLMAVDNNGELVFYASQDITYPLGSFHYTAFRGDEIGRIDTKGNMMVGKNLNGGDPSLSNSGSYYFDTLLSGASGRSQFASMELMQVNDPPDISGTRIAALTGNDERSGADAVVTLGGDTITIPTGDFQTVDKGKSISLNGVAYTLTEITSPTTATIDPVYAAASGTVAWGLSMYPYPSNMGGNSDGEALFQIRWQPMVHPFVRAGTDGVTNGTTTFTSATAAFTSADVNRKIMLNDNVDQIFTISTVSAATAVLLNTAGPGAAVNVPWSISKSHAEGTAVRAATLNGTIGGLMAADARKWATTDKLHAPMDMFFSLIPGSLVADGSSGTVVLWLRGEDSSVEVPGTLRLNGAIDHNGTTAGFFSATPVTVQSATATSGAFTAGAGTASVSGSSWVGNVGTKSYSVSDVVTALKKYGLLSS